MIDRLLSILYQLLGVARDMAANAVLWHIAMGLAGIAAIVAGVHVQFGVGWALMAGGIGLLGASAYIKRGLNG
ncbi:hypothetical protein [Delftia tsuruhatensis]|uniref:Uncharacterized protein n=1 Tax=Delftia tsuruhatensis TaxID=180282 RepID=A0ABM6E4U6_9BURK|nr:hypothetical protein [Delftia tsuruhatensis]AOV01691.1 hypothetical protein BI380_10160 [Delftia tsuruhatensis]AOV02397.1 hypothetical protein BI380_14150 [Delftia tsuruhatensis]